MSVSVAEMWDTATIAKGGQDHTTLGAPTANAK